MAIDWDAETDVPDQTVLLITEPPGGPRRRGLESTELPQLTDGERIERLEACIAQQSESAGSRHPDPELIKQVIQGATTALAKVTDPDARFSFRERAGLEAVVITDGTRPSLPIKGGFVDSADPRIGGWDQPFRRFGDAMRRVVAAVGRVNIPTNKHFAGTCFAIGPDLVMTNRHVLEAIAREVGAGEWRLTYPEATTIDFVGEVNAQSSTAFRVLSVAFAGPDAIRDKINFTRLDLAVLRVESGGGLPTAVRLESDPDAVKDRRDLYLVGFPARPNVFQGAGTPPRGNETSAVMESVFAWKFGVKTLAPGRVAAAPGDIEEDPRKWVFSHDASTLAGNSGSAVVDLSIDGARVIGLHFGGRSRDENWSHALARIQELPQAVDISWV
ncbi:serine protease [Microbacterium sp. SS28]|uniref:trypsin-like serine peptidase n=1 Tax=Microbacterium sp. SS28 TaxID=2919948 RepID=UPI001FA9AD25|nr:serine protease [Microbacterium sp. SS28]